MSDGGRIGARRSSGYTRVILLRALVTSYVVTGIVLASLVTVLDHHGAERNPGHSHATPLGEAGTEHRHAFEGLHLHRAPDAYLHHGVEPMLAGADARPDVTAGVRPGDASGAFIAATSVALPATLGLFSAGWLLPSLPLAPVALLTWASLLLTTALRHQVIFAPPLHPPAARAH